MEEGTTSWHMYNLENEKIRIEMKNIIMNSEDPQLSIKN